MDETETTLPATMVTEAKGAQRRSRVGRRRALGLASASAMVGVAGVITGGRPAAAADPNDVVKNADNPVTAPTSLTGSVDDPLLELENTSTFTGARALRARSNARDTGTVRGDNTNDSGIGGVGILGWAPGGRDLVAFGSGRIAMNSHQFNLTTRTYTVGELHHTDGTLYTMVFRFGPPVTGRARKRRRAVSNRPCSRV